MLKIQEVQKGKKQLSLSFSLKKVNSVILSIPTSLYSLENAFLLFFRNADLFRICEILKKC